MGVRIQNKSIEPVTLPTPFRGVLAGLQSVVLSLAYSELVALWPSAGGGVLYVENLGDSYAGPNDDLVYGSGDLVALGGFRQSLVFGMPNVAAGDNATPASSTPVRTYVAGVSALSTAGWVAPRAGSLTGLSVSLSGAAAGSNAIFGIYVNGTIANAAAIVTLASATSDTKAYITFAKDLYAFAAGDVIDVRLRTGSGWSATTVDAAAFVEIEC